jgi:endonuclease-3
MATAHGDVHTAVVRKRAFDIDAAMKRIASAVEGYAKAALFELRDGGFTTAFEQLVACMISIRTLDEVTIRVARAFFARARTAEAVCALSVREIDELIHACSFHEAKARQIRTIAERVQAEYGGDLPCDYEVLISLPGVGPKCANLVLGVACDLARIGVDIHVHRVTNRWGYVQAKTPERTTAALEDVLPRRYWVEINRLLVPFGKHICTGVRPRCSTCPILDMCQQVGVTTHR